MMVQGWVEIRGIIEPSFAPQTLSKIFQILVRADTIDLFKNRQISSHPRDFSAV